MYGCRLALYTATRPYSMLVRRVTEPRVVLSRPVGAAKPRYVIDRRVLHLPGTVFLFCRPTVSLISTMKRLHFLTEAGSRLDAGPRLQAGPRIQAGVQIDCTDRSRAPVTSRVPDTSRG